MNRSVVLSAFLLAFGIFLGGATLGSAIKKFHDFDKYVEVKGLDERIVKANQATLQISFSNAADDLGKIYDMVLNSQKTVAQFLVKAGFEESEIQREPISVTDNKSNVYAVQTNANVPRYTATAAITLVTNKVDLVAQTNQNTTQLIQQGILITSNTVRYAYTDLNSIKSDMLDKATQNARDAAQSFAKIAKSDLGTIRRAQQGVFTITPEGSSSDYDDSTIMKKVRIVTSIQFFLQ